MKETLPIFGPLWSFPLQKTLTEFSLQAKQGKMSSSFN